MTSFFFFQILSPQRDKYFTILKRSFVHLPVVVRIGDQCGCVEETIVATN
jgi:hypothetical protein